MIEKVISGGQTGVDRAALDIAVTYGVPLGGWCPKGRKAEDGPIPLRYPLKETPTEVYTQRTEWNVRDSDGTLVLSCGIPTEGTAFTIQAAARLGRPHLVIDLDQPPDPSVAWQWIMDQGIRVLNVAGPRESKCPGIHRRAHQFLSKVLR